MDIQWKMDGNVDHGWIWIEFVVVSFAGELLRSQEFHRSDRFLGFAGIRTSGVVWKGAMLVAHMFRWAWNLDDFTTSAWVVLYFVTSLTFEFFFRPWNPWANGPMFRQVPAAMGKRNANLPSLGGVPPPPSPLGPAGDLNTMAKMQEWRQNKLYWRWESMKPQLVLWLKFRVGSYINSVKSTIFMWHNFTVIICTPYVVAVQPWPTLFAEELEQDNAQLRERYSQMQQQARQSTPNWKILKGVFGDFWMWHF